MFEFKPFPKIPRLLKECVITEKIDGTNACVVVSEDGLVYAQSRKRLITPSDDNYGFAAWVAENMNALRDGLGPGHHHGEWWGRGIQRGYGISERRFSLFNTRRWVSNPAAGYQCYDCPVCHVVPVFTSTACIMTDVPYAMATLIVEGSRASKGFQHPEGLMVYHTGSGQYYKYPIESEPKTSK